MTLDRGFFLRRLSPIAAVRISANSNAVTRPDQHLLASLQSLCCVPAFAGESKGTAVRNLERSEETQLTADLMARVPGSFDRFVDHFRAKIYHYSLMMCGQREDAEEVAQDTLLKVFSNFSQLRDPERVRPWVFRVAKNECFMKRRRSVFAPAHELSLDELMPSNDGGKLQIADWSRLPDDEVLRKELHATLSEAIRSLPENYRSVLLLRDVEELSTRETADVLGISEDAVKQTLHRARLAVRKTIDGRLIGRQS